jgi:hypothetical protein
MAKKIYRSRVRSHYHRSLAGSTVAAKMRKSGLLSGHASKYAKMKRVTPERLDKELPDYISGSAIWEMFKK